MQELVNGNGINCGNVRVFQEDGKAWAMAVSWRRSVDGLPDEQAFHGAIEASIEECIRQGALYVDTRVITATEGTSESLTAARAALHRDALVVRGFERGEDRVEYQMDLADAVNALDVSESSSGLVWKHVDASNESELAWAAGLYRQASEGDPASSPDQDALGFLRALLGNGEIVQSPERLQIGMCGDEPAAFLALMVYPSDGWSTIYFLGVLPAFRGRGLGAVTMRHGLQSLQAMGGRIYHDGTAAGNAPARALFAHLGCAPFRTMEEWRLSR
jgi:ribosomal protein S18 acetylase RimI-like enzyme